MFAILKRSPLAVTLAILLHVLIVLFLIFGMEFELFPKRVTPKANVVQAHMVNTEKLQQAAAEEQEKIRKQKALEAQKRKQADEEKRRLAETAKHKAEEEAKAKRVAEEQRKVAAEAKRKAKAEAQAKQQAALEAKRKAEAKAKAEAQAKAKQLAEQKRKAEAEAKRKAEAEAKAKAEAEAKRQAALAAKREAAERAERERALQEQLAAEQNAREIDRYVAVIKQQVERSWLRPPQNVDGLSCVVQVRLIPGGDVVPGGVSIIKSSGNDAFDRSVESAVYKAAPLPVPSGALFESFRNLRINFKPS
ncbi:MAG: cell envelope integrity protein TolA [Candidatus Thiodiazotropha sp.]